MIVCQDGTEVHIELPLYGTAGERMTFAMECHEPVIAGAMAEYIRRIVLPDAILKELVNCTDYHDDRLSRGLLAKLKRNLGEFNMATKQWGPLR